MAIIYQHKRKDNNQIFYIGIGKNKIRANSIHGRGKFWKSYTKNIEWFSEIIEDNLSWEEACNKEKELIFKLGRRDLGLGNLVNQTNGGDGNNKMIMSLESNKKRSESLKGRKKPKNFNIGRIHSEDTKLKISESHIGKKKPWVKWTKDQIKNRGLSRRILTKDQHTIILELKNKGISLSKISKELNISLGIVKKWHKKEWE